MERSQAILYERSVPDTQKMMVALMTSMATGCRYFQGHTANLSHVHDMPDEKINAVRDCETSPLFTDAERAALILAREAAGVFYMVDTDHFDMLTHHFSENDSVEVAGNFALFGDLNHWNDTMATSMKPHPAQVAVQAIPNCDDGKHRIG